VGLNGWLRSVDKHTEKDDVVGIGEGVAVIFVPEVGKVERLGIGSGVF